MNWLRSKTGYFVCIVLLVVIFTVVHNRIVRMQLEEQEERYISEIRQLQEEHNFLLQSQAESGLYKTVGIFEGPRWIESRIPGNWSYQTTYETRCEDQNGFYPSLSFAPKGITYSDFAWTQTDVCISLKSVDEVKKTYESFWGGYWDTEFLPGLGVSVDVYNFPDDNGEITKGGTKGKDYLIPEVGCPGCTTVIKKQALTDNEEYEEGFRYFINNLVWKDVSDYLNN